MLDDDYFTNKEEQYNVFSKKEDSDNGFGTQDNS